MTGNGVCGDCRWMIDRNGKIRSGGRCSVFPPMAATTTKSGVWFKRPVVFADMPACSLFGMAKQDGDRGVEEDPCLP